MTGWVSLPVLRVEPDTVAGVTLDEIEGSGRLEAVEGHAPVFGQKRMPRLLRQAVFEEESID